MNDRLILGLGCLAVAVSACGKQPEPLADPEGTALQIIEERKDQALGCVPEEEGEEPKLDEAMQEGNSGALAAARLGRIGAAQCVGAWAQKTMAAMTTAGVPETMARQVTHGWVVENLGSDIALVF
jgi:isoaspartyl peptidase/L-asparaginase-like protein (Ntn-hydrolase superfamily)